jgi:5-methyltetrahydrofolate--homocysteine methyltransferase
MSDLQTLRASIARGDRRESTRLTQALVDAGTPPQEILDGGLVRGMADIGERFGCGRAFVPELLIAARAMKESLNLLEPLLTAAGVTPKYTAVIGTVQGDLHDIGKNLVAMMWRGANIRVIDLGVNVPAHQFVQAVQDYKPDVVGLSALLTTTMPAMRETVKALKRVGADGTSILVGGAPITRQFAADVGADGFAADAAAAVDVVLNLVGAGAGAAAR